MNSDEASSRINWIIARARRERQEEERQFLIQRAVQNATDDSSIAAALLGNHRQQSLLTSPRGLAGSISTAESLTESYLLQRPTWTTSPALTSLNPDLNPLRLARSLAARLGSPSIPIRGALTPSAAAQSGIGAHSNTALNQLALPDKPQLTFELQRQKRPCFSRHEDLLIRTRENMVRKPGKKAKIAEQQLQEEKQSSVSPPRPAGAASAKIPVKKRMLVVRQQKLGFLLPPAGEYRQRSIGVQLESYRSLWDKLGGFHGKERFQRRVQNGKVAMIVRQSPKGVQN
jgi:hypothetical protein